MQTPFGSSSRYLNSSLERKEDYFDALRSYFSGLVDYAAGEAASFCPQDREPRRATCLSSPPDWCCGTLSAIYDLCLI